MIQKNTVKSTVYDTTKAAVVIYLRKSRDYKTHPDDKTEEVLKRAGLGNITRNDSAEIVDGGMEEST